MIQRLATPNFHSEREELTRSRFGRMVQMAADPMMDASTLSIQSKCLMEVLQQFTRMDHLDLDEERRKAGDGSLLWLWILLPLLLFLLLIALLVWRLCCSKKPPLAEVSKVRETPASTAPASAELGPKVPSSSKPGSETGSKVSSSPSTSSSKSSASK